MAHIDEIKPKLTIAIPSYNRQGALKKTIEALLPQLTNECYLLIIDNHSDIPVSDYIDPLFSNYPDIQYSIVRNKKNIGGDSNITRCFENCETEWLWTLGDDDDIVNDAIRIILNDISTYADVLNINYYSPLAFHPIRRTKTKTAKGRLEFLENIDFFGTSIFLSVNVYNVGKLKNHWLVYNNTYSCCPHWLFIYYSAGPDEITIQSDKILCINASNETQDNYSSNNLTFSKGFATLLDFVTSKKEKDIIISKLRGVTNEWITFESIVKCLLVEYFRSDGQIDILFLLKRYYDLFYKLLGFKYKVKYYIYMTSIFVSPKMSFKIIRKIILNKKGIDIRNYI